MNGTVRNPLSIDCRRWMGTRPDPCGEKPLQPETQQDNRDAQREGREGRDRSRVARFRSRVARIRAREKRETMKMRNIRRRFCDTMHILRTHVAKSRRLDKACLFVSITTALALTHPPTHHSLNRYCCSIIVPTISKIRYLILPVTVPITN